MGPSKAYTTPAHAVPIKIPDALISEGLFLSSAKAEANTTRPEWIISVVLAKVDAYASHWIATRSAWQATIEDIRSVTNFVVNDCTFPCPTSFNGLCAGATDLHSTTTVALYQLKRSRTKPAGWDEPGTYLNPRSSEDMRDLAYANGQYWVNDEPNEYYWCSLPASNMGMPALQHEWDHILPRMDPHDPADLNLVSDVPLSHFTSALAPLGL